MLWKSSITYIIGVKWNLFSQVPELPVFMLEPDDPNEEEPNKERLDTPKNRLRTDSYCGAVGINANNNREEYLSHLRAGAQKVLQVFFCNSAAVFLLFQIPKHEAAVSWCTLKLG